MPKQAMRQYTSLHTSVLSLAGHKTLLLTLPAGQQRSRPGLANGVAAPLLRCVLKGELEDAASLLSDPLAPHARL
eukprot:scaffold14658_cov67-Phaeocystis_antarctica.AAC.13